MICSNDCKHMEKQTRTHVRFAGTTACAKQWGMRPSACECTGRSFLRDMQSVLQWGKWGKCTWQTLPLYSGEKQVCYERICSKQELRDADRVRRYRHAGWCNIHTCWCGLWSAPILASVKTMQVSVQFVRAASVKKKSRIACLVPHRRGPGKTDRDLHCSDRSCGFYGQLGWPCQKRN